MTDSDPVATIEALPYGQRAAAALGESFLDFAAALDSLSFERVRARLRGCQASSKGWDAAVEARRPKERIAPKTIPAADKWMLELRRGEEDRPLATPMNAGLIFRNWAPFETLRLNSLSLEAELEGKPWRDGDSFRWQEAIEKQFDVSFSKDTIDAAVEAVAEEREYHPFREKLDALPHWDGVPRFEVLARDIFGSSDPLAPRLIECFLLGAVARTYVPGEKMDTILTLFSREHGTGKTSAIVALCYGLVYIGNIDPKDKDTVMNCATSVCACIDEVDEFTTRSEWPAIKRFLSQLWDTFRAPYGRRPRKWMRRFVFAATTNRDDILRDETGNRRWHIIEVSDMAASERIKLILGILDQLWAEARHKWMEGTNNGIAKPKDYLWWLTPEEEKDRREGAKAFEERSIVDDKVESYVAQYDKDGTSELRIENILMSGLDVEREKVSTSQGLERRVGSVLRKLGYQNCESSVPGSRARVWKRKTA